MYQHVLASNEQDNNHINVMATFICINHTMMREGFVAGVLQTVRAKPLDCAIFPLKAHGHKHLLSPITIRETRVHVGTMLREAQ